MSVETPCPKDSPLMIAWEAHKATDEYKNSSHSVGEIRRALP